MLLSYIREKLSHNYELLMANSTDVFNHIKAISSSLVYVPVLNQFEKLVSTDLAQLALECLSLEKCGLDDETIARLLEIELEKETLRFVKNHVIYILTYQLSLKNLLLRELLYYILSLIVFY